MNNNLCITPATIKNFVLQESLAYENELTVNRIWYAADASLIEQIFKKLGGNKRGDDVASGRFWAAVPMSGLAIRKIHSGLPAQIVNTITDLIGSDMGAVKFNDKKLDDFWENMAGDLEFTEAIQECITDTLVDGDGAFKIYLDNEISDYPILDYYSGDRVQCEWNGKRLHSVAFYTQYTYDKKQYELREIYTKGRIDYELYDQSGNKLHINSIPQTADLKDYVEFNLQTILAVPCCFYKSNKHKDRGKSIYDGKWECFDALDEAISSWRDAERDARTKNYIPEDLIPRDANGGELMTPNPFQFRYITLGAGIDLEDGKVQTVQSTIDYNAHMAAISSCLDLCLQGILSPATLGINIAADASGESQRERKDTTAITRNHITNRLEKVIKKLCKTIMELYCYCNGIKHDDIRVDFSFGEYAALDFGGRIELMNKANPGKSIMSIETMVDELWGDSKDEEWKKQEVERLKNEDAVMIDETPFPTDDSIKKIADDTDDEYYPGD